MDDQRRSVIRDACDLRDLLSRGVGLKGMKFLILDSLGTKGESMNEVGRLQAAIRKHRDYEGDDRCWMDDEELYKVLPEGYTPPIRSTAVEKHNCDRFIACRHNPGTEYVSPQREIERLQRQAGRDWLVILGLASVICLLIAELLK